MTNNLISKNKINLAIELYIAGELYRSELLLYDEYIRLVQVIKKKYQ